MNGLKRLFSSVWRPMGGFVARRSAIKRQTVQEAWIPPECEIEFDLPAQCNTSEYFAYVSVADIPEPPYPQNTTDKWHRTSTEPSELRQVMHRFKVMMKTIRDREGDSEPPDNYWREYWSKYDRLNRFPARRSWARLYDTFYGSEMVRVEKYGTEYRLDSGMHRTWLAKRLGFEKLPVLVIEYFEPQ